MLDLWFKMTFKVALFWIWINVAEYLWEEVIIHRESEEDEESQMIGITFSHEDCYEKIFESKK